MKNTSLFVDISVRIFEADFASVDPVQTVVMASCSMRFVSHFKLLFSDADYDLQLTNHSQKRTQ